MNSAFFRCLFVVAMVTSTLASPAAFRRDEESYSGPLSELAHIHLPRLQGQDRPSLLPGQDRPSLLQGQERLPLPTPQELEAIKKVAQILIMLGEQVIPAIINEPAPMPSNCEAVDSPPDVVDEN